MYGNLSPSILEWLQLTRASQASWVESNSTRPLLDLSFDPGNHLILVGPVAPASVKIFSKVESSILGTLKKCKYLVAGRILFFAARSGVSNLLFLSFSKLTKDGVPSGRV